MLNAIPIFGWMLSLVIAAVMAVPVWAIWTWGGLGVTYGTMLPEAWQAIPYTHLTGLFVVMATVRAVAWSSIRWDANGK